TRSASQANGSVPGRALGETALRCRPVLHRPHPLWTQNRAWWQLPHARPDRLEGQRWRPLTPTTFMETETRPVEEHIDDADQPEYEQPEYEQAEYEQADYQQPEHEQLEATGEPRVDAALRRLGELGDLPVSEHPPVFERVHSSLVDVLGELRS